VSTSVQQEPETGRQSPEGDALAKAGGADVKRALIGLVGLVITVYLMVTAFQFIVIFDLAKLVQAAVAIAAGVGGAMALFYFLNMTVEGLPQRVESRLKPYVFVLPAVAFIGLFLIYPTVQTIVYSFADDESEAWVGFQNYQDILGDPDFRETLFNNFLWILIVPAVTVTLGLLVAVLADKLSDSWEKTSKSVIFLPMAISFVGAATIWRFVYDSKVGDTQIGLQNGIVTALGFDPVSWLQLDTFSVNDLLLMVILVWLQVGFSMVLLSAAIKSVPEETLEAARIDGASEVQTFFQVVVPQIRGTLITVFITVLILVMKVFDVVYVMTGGDFGTNVIGLEFFLQIFQFGNNGIAAAIVVLLMLAVIPVLIYQVRHFREEEATR
jgi:alpha-glucoside transport system permease protein